MIGIRVDINETIATGHFMRCLSIAQGIRNAKDDVLFISADERAKVLAQRYHFQAVQLGTKWDEPDSEVDELKAIINEYRIDKLLVDSYYVTERYLQKLFECVELVYIDDINRFRYCVDTLINYNVYFGRFNYTEVNRGTNTKLILGPQYAPLRREFKDVSRKVNDTVCNILVTTGGSDTYGTAEQVVQALIQDEELARTNIHIIAGRYTKIDKKIELNMHPNVFIHKNVGKMSELMMQCDIAVTAGGSTMYELCACGLPSISFSFADNQILGCEAFDTMELISYSGDVRNGMDACITKIVNSIRYYAKHHKGRMNKSQAMQVLVDGRGVDRIVKEVFRL